ncbi:MAG: nucleolar RNA-binding Nop10p family protein [Candidatus Nanoarchaeia archaeon]
MKLKKCKTCNLYALKDNCTKCKQKTINAHYKFVKVKTKSPVSLLT